MDIDSIQTGPLGVNTFIVPLAGRAVLVVDPAGCAYSDDERTVVNYLDERDLTPVGILLTHGHFDHVSGLNPMRAAFPSIPVAIHGSDAAFIGKNSSEMQKKSLCAMGLGNEEGLLAALSGLPEPVFALSDGESLDKYFTAGDIISAFTGDNAPDIEAALNALSHWRVMHTPGHTQGSVCFYNESEGALISGDTVFYHSYGRTDLPGGSEHEMQKSLERIFKELPPETLVYPGHEAAGFELGNNL